MPPAPPPPDEEDYDSAADSNFDASLSPSSGDESDASDVAGAAKKPAGTTRNDEDGDVQMESGDEGIVAQGRKKRRKKAKNKDGEAHEGFEDDDHDGGVGIRVRLRSGRGG